MASFRTAIPIPRGGVIVLIDDNVHSGRSLAALGRLLGASRTTSALAVAVTDAEPCKDALKGRKFRVEYDETSPDLAVTRVLEPVR
ncbi:MAG: hypothetical protein H7138_27675 [Myxococcales bacterium]|nr:hypothetical protein [Myxococcales bacterium]